MEKQAVARMSSQDMLAQLHCSEQGLRQTEVARRRLQYGPNALTTERTTALRVVGRQFQSALIYFLVVAAVLSFATQDLSDGAIITVILLINAGLGFSQEYRSERAVEKLSHLISDKILAKRDGTSILLDVATLVPGDVVILKEGDVVPADIKLLTADNVQVDESQLTGESVPVPKAVQVGTVDGGEASLLFTGSTMDKGAAMGVVYAIANETELGKIAALSTSIHKVTQYEQSLRAFSALLMKTIGVALAVALAIKVVLGGGAAHWSLLLIFVIALAVAVVPEALPVIARVSPEQKFAIIQALKAHHVVGYQGDGINDAPALKLADVGIAVDSATDVAKANADIILLDKDLGVIINGLKYGRTIFANINKYIKYTMVGNFGNFFALAALYLLSTDLPLLPRQVLLISLLTDLPLVAISTDTVSSDELEQPDRYNTRALLSISLVLGTLTAFFELAFFATLHGQAASASQTSLYLFFSFTQLIL